MQITPNDCAKSEGTITHLHTWRSIWSPPHSANTGVQKRSDSKFLGAAIQLAGYVLYGWQLQRAMSHYQTQNSHLMWQFEALLCDGSSYVLASDDDHLIDLREMTQNAKQWNQCFVYFYTRCYVHEEYEWTNIILDTLNSYIYKLKYYRNGERTSFDLLDLFKSNIKPLPDSKPPPISSQILQRRGGRGRLQHFLPNWS